MNEREQVLIGSKILDIKISKEKVMVKFIKNGKIGAIEFCFSEWLWVGDIIFDDEEWKDKIFADQISSNIINNIISSKKIQIRPETMRKLNWTC